METLHSSTSEDASTRAQKKGEKRDAAVGGREGRNQAAKKIKTTANRSVAA